jgi:hypothetical protein
MWGFFRPLFGLKKGASPLCLRFHSVFGNVEGDLANVVHDGPQFPNHALFFTSPVVDSAEAFGVSDVGEDGLNCVSD